MKTFGFEIFDRGTSVYYDENIVADSYEDALQKTLDAYTDYMNEETHEEDRESYEFVKELIPKLIELGTDTDALKKHNIRLSLLPLMFDDPEEFYTITVE